jgi:nucleotide-binding universal stress UspA family protein
MQVPNSPVLFPTDFQAHSQSAFEHAVHLAATNQAKLIALHVSNMPDMPWSTPSHPTHHEFLRDKLRQLESSRVEIEQVFAVADPGPEICRLAKKYHCGMIVMGVTIKTGIDQAVFGSVHDYVQQNATCPVVTLCQQRACVSSATVETNGP